MKIKILLLLLILNACSTTNSSVLLGASIGGVTGGLTGNAISKNTTGVAIGTVVGLGLGGFLGYLLRKNTPAPNTQKLDEEEMPSMTKAKIRSIIVPDTIEGNRYIKSHKVFILENAGSWSKD